MFFVAKEKIGTTLGAQKEYTACERRGIRFHSDGNVWHFLWPIDLVEPSIRERFNAQPQEQRPVVGQDEDAIHGASTGAVVPFSEHAEVVNAEPDHVIWSQEVMPGSVVGEPVVSAFSGSSPNWVAEAREKYTAEIARRAQEQ